MKTDTLFYRLFQRWPKIALELLDLEYLSESYRFGSEEIKQTAFRLDGLLTPVEDNTEQPLIFVEVQYQSDSDFYDRFFSEITLYLRLHKPSHPWLALVIYPERSTEKAANVALSFHGLTASASIPNLTHRWRNCTYCPLKNWKTWQKRFLIGLKLAI
jgi:predicted transposase/invertase (TIGR01784 family)